MNPINHQAIHLIQALLRHRSEILDTWLERMDIDEESFLFRANPEMGHVLASYLDAMKEILGNGYPGRLPFQQNGFLYDAVRSELDVLLTGEEVIVEILKKYYMGSTGNWLEFRQGISRAFRELLRFYMSQACLRCRWILNNGNEKLWALESELQHKCGHV